MADRWKQANTVNAYLVLKVFAGYRNCASQPDAPFGDAGLDDREVVIEREAFHFFHVARGSAALGRERLSCEVRPSRRQLQGACHRLARPRLRDPRRGAGARPKDDRHFDPFVRIQRANDLRIGKGFLLAAGDARSLL